MCVDAWRDGEMSDQMKIKNCDIQSKDTPQPMILKKEEDSIVRKTARKLVARSWEMLRFCTKVVDENDTMLCTMLMKEKVKRKVFWEVEEERKF